MIHTRKLVKAGTASHTVSLPKEWLDKNRLKKGDTLFITESSETELRISPKMEEEAEGQKEITIDVDSKETGTVQREITSAYLNNYSQIHLTGKTINEKSKKLRGILHHFVALEVDEQTGSRISAKDLLNMKEISIDKTIRRMDMTLRSVMQDSINAIGGKQNQESIEQRDDEVNRLYFLLFRILKSALSSQKVSSSLGITNNDILSTWYLTVSMENMADNAKSVSMLSGKINDRKLLKDIYTEIWSAYEDVMKAYYNRDKKLADDVASRRIGIFTKCSKLLITTPTAGSCEMIENLKGMATHVCDIARIVIDNS